jgi:hypothetical protein
MTPLAPRLAHTATLYRQVPTIELTALSYQRTNNCALNAGAAGVAMIAGSPSIV